MSHLSYTLGIPVFVLWLLITLTGLAILARLFDVVAYWLGAGLALFTVCLLYLPRKLSRRLYRTHFGQNLFLWFSRIRYRWWMAAAIPAAAASFGLEWRYSISISILPIVGWLYSICVLNLYLLRPLSIYNRGRGTWSVHLDPTTRTLLESGVKGMLKQVFVLADEARIQTLEFNSPLLVDVQAARVLKAMLERAGRTQGLEVEVQMHPAKSKGAFETGGFLPMRRVQRNLKALRMPMQSKYQLLSRNIEVHIRRT
jgi:hypothetical protein